MPFQFLAEESFGSALSDLKDHVQRGPAVQWSLTTLMAPTTAETRSEPVEVITRAVNVASSSHDPQPCSNMFLGGRALAQALHQKHEQIIGSMIRYLKCSDSACEA
jgi:hypothetical protein